MLKLKTLVFLALIALLIAVPALAQDKPTISLGSSDNLGSFLVGPNGMTLYLFTPDALDSSNCYEACAERWPPFLVRNADGLSLAEGIPGEIGTIERTTGTVQVTYNGMPLYYWFLDYAPGETKGQSVGGVWWIVPPATVYVSNDDQLGKILVGPTGNTLYLFTKDVPGTSNCYDKCATNWPPLLVDSADAVVSGVNVPGELATTTRTDGTLQVTYNSWPLYYWKDDAARGDTTGEAVGDVWYTIVPETLLASSKDGVGDFLTAVNGRTLYTFKNDTAGVSNCTGDCAKDWRPLTVGANDRLTASTGIEGELATITRDDGSRQVTYNDLPLYFWKDDKAPGDTNGQGVGDVWAVAAP